MVDFQAVISEQRVLQNAMSGTTWSNCWDAIEAAGAKFNAINEDHLIAYSLRIQTLPQSGIKGSNPILTISQDSPGFVGIELFENFIDYVCEMLDNNLSCYPSRFSRAYSEI